MHCDVNLDPCFLFSFFVGLSFFPSVVHTVFSSAGAFNGDLSAWNVGAVTNMQQSKYALAVPLALSPDRVLFWGLLFFLFSFFWCALMFYNVDPYFLSSLFLPLGLLFFPVVHSVFFCWCL